jgi:hypothetical protein
MDESDPRGNKLFARIKIPQTEDGKDKRIIHYESHCRSEGS